MGLSPEGLYGAALKKISHPEFPTFEELRDEVRCLVAEARILKKSGDIHELNRLRTKIASTQRLTVNKRKRLEIEMRKLHTAEAAQQLHLLTFSPPPQVEPLREVA